MKVSDKEMDKSDDQKEITTDEFVIMIIISWII